MKKYIALVLALLFALFFVGCRRDVTLEEAKVYQLESHIRSLKIQINAADFTIKQADKFLVKSNLKYLSVSEDDGVLTILEEVKNAGTYTDAMLTLYVPTGTIFEDVVITTGAARLAADDLSAETLTLQLGAGDVRIESLNATSRIDIEGGAGKITIAGGTLNNLELEMGLGELNLTAALLGNSDLVLGVGKSNLTLIGSKDDYKVDIEKGLGSITVDGRTVSDFDGSGNGQNYIEVEGGVGAINLKFEEAETP